MSDQMGITAADLDLGRFDDPLYAEPRVGLGGVGGWITFGFARGSQAQGTFRLGYARDALESFATEEEAQRCARELAAVFERYGITTKVKEA